MIIDSERMTQGMARYWNKKAHDLQGKVDVVDPWRLPLATIRSRYPKGTRVYRASTGGKWGKSAKIVTL